MYKLVADPEYPVGAPISQEGYMSFFFSEDILTV